MKDAGLSLYSVHGLWFKSCSASVSVDNTVKLQLGLEERFIQLNQRWYIQQLTNKTVTHKIQPQLSVITKN